MQIEGNQLLRSSIVFAWNLKCYGDPQQGKSHP